jgi:hypothetical protein
MPSQDTLLKRIYGSREAAKQAWEAQKQREDALRAAREYVRGRAPISLFGRRRPRKDGP